MSRRSSSLESDIGTIDSIIDDILKHKFLEPFPIDNDEGNGLLFNNVYFPEEVVTKILTLVGPSGILQKALVCKRWCNIIKSTHYWAQIYAREHHKTPKILPWYVFYCYFCRRLLNCNLLKNCRVDEDQASGSVIDEESCEYLGTNPLPPNVPDFNGCPRCFVTSGNICVKNQSIDLLHSKLLFYIVSKYCPDIYMSDRVISIPDWSGKYTLEGTLLQIENVSRCAKAMYEVALGEGGVWKKIEVVFRHYSDHIIDMITFQQKVINEWDSSERYGFKMTGGVIKILMESINVEGPD